MLARDKFLYIFFSTTLIVCVYCRQYSPRRDRTIDYFSPDELDTGYDPEDSIKTRVVDKIKCGYLFNAQMHLQLTTMLLQKLDTEVIGQVVSLGKSFSYVEESIRMIHSLLRVHKRPSLNEIWLLNVYAYKIREYYSSVLAGSTPSPEVKDVNMEMHNFVVAHLKRFTDVHCGRGNRFDSRSDRCTICKKYPAVVNDGRAHVVHKQIVMNENKMAVNELIIDNAIRGLGVDIGDTFYNGRLYFGDIVLRDDIMDYLLIHFAKSVDWGTMRKTLTDVHNRAKHQPGLNAIKSLLAYQSTIVDILKIIVLQMTRKRVLQLIAMDNHNHDYVINYRIFLSEFADFLFLNNDLCLQYLIGKFKLNLTSFVHNRRDILYRTTQEIENMCNRLGCKATVDMGLGDVGPLETYDETILNVVLENQQIRQALKQEPIDDTLISSRIFLVFLQHVFGDSLDFEVVNSFNKITHILPI